MGLIMSTNMNKKEIADEFLLRTEDIIEEIHCRTMGEESAFPEANLSMLMKYFDIYAEIVKNVTEVGEIQKIEAETTADIIKMLKDGGITIRDAKDLMSMLSIQSDIEDIKTLLAKVQQLTGDGQTL